MQFFKLFEGGTWEHFGRVAEYCAWGRRWLVAKELLKNNHHWHSDLGKSWAVFDCCDYVWVMACKNISQAPFQHVQLAVSWFHVWSRCAYDTLHAWAGGCAGRGLCVPQQVPWFALLQAVEGTMECYSLAAASPLTCWCKWSRKTALREMSCYLFSLRAGEFLDCIEPVLSCLVPDVSIASVFGIHVF